MRRYQSLGIGILSSLFLGSMIAACSASGNDPTVVGGPASGDSGANADTSYDYGDSASDIPQPDGSTTVKDSGPVVPFDAGPPPPPSNDCDLGGSNASTYITDLGGGSLPACGVADACGAGMCCLNLTGSIPASFSALLAALGGGIPTGGCVTE